HTSFSRDWSSDVCSSDLEKEPWDKIVSHLSAEVGENDVVLLLPNDLYLPARLYVTDPHLAARIKSVPAPYPAVGYSDFYPDGFQIGRASVGKEWRSRGWR